jgi:hypothetical protein
MCSNRLYHKYYVYGRQERLHFLLLGRIRWLRYPKPFVPRTLRSAVMEP